MISDPSTSYLCLRIGVRANDDGAVECGGPAVRKYATRQQSRRRFSFHEVPAVSRGLIGPAQASAMERIQP